MAFSKHSFHFVKSEPEDPDLSSIPNKHHNPGATENNEESTETTKTVNFQK